jgi:predicted metalloendopeptidase
MEFEPSPEDVTADPSPGASERRTTHACDECGLVHDASGFVPRWTAEDIAASEKKARELADFFGVRDVIAAGDDNG